MGPRTESRIYQPKTMPESMPNALPRGGASRVHKPDLDEMGIATWHEVKPVQGKRPRKPPAGETGSGGSKIFQPTNSRESGPEFGPAPRSTGGAPGHRGGWKKR